MALARFGAGELGGHERSSSCGVKLASFEAPGLGSGRCSGGGLPGFGLYAKRRPVRLLSIVAKILTRRLLDRVAQSGVVLAVQPGFEPKVAL